MDEKDNANATNNTLPSDSQPGQSEVRVDLAGGQAADPAGAPLQDNAVATTDPALGGSEVPVTQASDTTVAPGVGQGYDTAGPTPTQAAEVGQAAADSAGVLPPAPAVDPAILQETNPTQPGVTPASVSEQPDASTLSPVQSTPGVPVQADPAAVPPTVPVSAPHHSGPAVAILVITAVVLLAVVAVLYVTR